MLPGRYALHYPMTLCSVLTEVLLSRSIRRLGCLGYCSIQMQWLWRSTMPWSRGVSSGGRRMPNCSGRIMCDEILRCLQSLDFLLYSYYDASEIASVLVVTLLGSTGLPSVAHIFTILWFPTVTRTPIRRKLSKVAKCSSPEGPWLVALLNFQHLVEVSSFTSHSSHFSMLFPWV